MEKPISIIIEELKQDIVNDINKAGLPIFLTQYILKDLYNETTALAQQQLLADQKEYEESFQTKKEEIENDN